MLKRDPEHHPTRFLAAIWEQCLAENFGIAGTHVSDKDQEMGQLKTLALVYAEGIPERVAKIEAAKTLIELQRAFLDTVDESIGASASPSPIAA
jgi:hypothetical protein